MFMLFGYTEFPKSGDKDILTGFKCCLYNIQRCLGKSVAFCFRVPAMIIKTFYDVRFVQCHKESPNRIEKLNGTTKRA